jgi:hypothetical protein
MRPVNRSLSHHFDLFLPRVMGMMRERRAVMIRKMGVTPAAARS